MKHDPFEQNIQQEIAEDTALRHEDFIPRLRAYFSAMPDVRLAYYQSGPTDEGLCLAGPERGRIVLHFTRSVSSEHIDKRLAKIQRHFASMLVDEMDFLDIERLDYREACEVAFNGQPVYGPSETIERDRLYRYNVFLEWNAGKRFSGLKQDTPPVFVPALDRPLRVLNVEQFIRPIHRHLKLIDTHLRELNRLTAVDLNAFSAESTSKSLAESYMLKAIQSAILITMSVMHRTMRLAARDYRDLFLLMPVFGMANRDLANRMARCAEIRDRLMFKYEDVTAVEIYQQASEVAEAVLEFKRFMLEWLFEHYYATSGELIQSE